MNENIIRNVFECEEIVEPGPLIVAMNLAGRADSKGLVKSEDIPYERLRHFYSKRTILKTIRELEGDGVIYRKPSYINGVKVLNIQFNMDRFGRARNWQ